MSTVMRVRKLSILSFASSPFKPQFIEVEYIFPFSDRNSYLYTHHNIYSGILSVEYCVGFDNIKLGMIYSVNVNRYRAINICMYVIWRQN